MKCELFKNKINTISHLYFIEDAIRLTSTFGRTATFLKRSEINQLHSIFSLLDGKRVPDTQKRLGNEINYKVSRDIRTFETEYFLVRWFKKGSMQLTFTRTDLIRQLNNLITVTFPAFFPKKSNDATLPYILIIDCQRLMIPN
ncbi:hypothetical protein CBG25_13100 [Arsenophonus sp. ENCA]|uniref:DUF4942 domain-containing protein n=1 Tax=Arsenophonus sp. ENCA TaxID=1987579 RepID=UPI000BDD634E|nr:hypothetical protein CBG25_13100 [Arsenophonus sp. ENCA]